MGKSATDAKTKLRTVPNSGPDQQKDGTAARCAERRSAMNELAIQASYEIEALSSVLSQDEMDERHPETFVYIVRGIACRINMLNDIIMSEIVDEDIGMEDVERFRRQLYGSCD